MQWRHQHKLNETLLQEPRNVHTTMREQNHSKTWWTAEKNYGHIQLYLPPSSFFPSFSLSLSHHHRLFELSFVSFSARNKIWKKIITEIKALIFFLFVSLFALLIESGRGERGGGGFAGANFRNDVITLFGGVRETQISQILSDANLILSLYHFVCVWVRENERKKLYFLRPEQFCKFSFLFFPPSPLPLSKLSWEVK